MSAREEPSMASQLPDVNLAQAQQDEEDEMQVSHRLFTHRFHILNYSSSSSLPVCVLGLCYG